MPQEINHDITVDPNGKASVSTRDVTLGGPGAALPDAFVLQPGDKVTFTSNRSDTVIRYPSQPPPPPLNGRPPVYQPGSPFSNLGADTDHPVAGVKKLTVVTSCTISNPFHFLCGRLLATGFSEWGAQTGHAAGGNTPSPDD
jgi:hypothetical protein